MYKDQERIIRFMPQPVICLKTTCAQCVHWLPCGELCSSSTDRERMKRQQGRQPGTEKEIVFALSMFAQFSAAQILALVLSSFFLHWAWPCPQRLKGKIKKRDQGEGEKIEDKFERNSLRVVTVTDGEKQKAGQMNWRETHWWQRIKSAREGGRGQPEQSIDTLWSSSTKDLTDMVYFLWSTAYLRVALRLLFVVHVGITVKKVAPVTSTGHTLSWDKSAQTQSIPHVPLLYHLKKVQNSEEEGRAEKF